MYSLTMTPYSDVRTVKARLVTESVYNNTGSASKVIGYTANNSITCTFYSNTENNGYGEYRATSSATTTTKTFTVGGSSQSMSGKHLIPSNSNLDLDTLGNRARYVGGSYQLVADSTTGLNKLVTTGTLNVMMTAYSEDMTSFEYEEMAENIYGFSTKELNVSIRWHNEQMATMFNTLSSYANTEYKPYVNIPDEEAPYTDRWCPLGVLKYAKSNSESNYKGIHITAMDSLSFISGEQYTTSYTDRQTSAVCMSEMIDTTYASYFPYGYDGTIATDFADTVTHTFYKSTRTAQDILKDCACMNGGLLKTTRDGKLKLVKPSPSSPATQIPIIGGIAMNGYNRQSMGSVSIESLQCQEYFYGEDDDNCLTIDCIYMSQEELDDIGETLPLTFVPATLEYRGDPRIEVGDWVQVQTGNNTYNLMPVLSHSISITGGMSATLESINVSNIASLTEKMTEQVIAPYTNEELDDMLAGTIVAQVIKYGVGSSSTSYSDITQWSDTQPTRAEGQYLWKWTHIVYGDGLEANAYECVTGDKGDDAPVYYTWIVYANSTTPTPQEISTDPAGKSYMGIAYNKTSPTPSTTYTDYNWSLIKGADGQSGKGVASTTRYYRQTTDPPSNPPSRPTTMIPIGWQTTEPSYSNGQYLYVTVRTVYTDNTFEYSDVGLVSSYDAIKNLTSKMQYAKSSSSTTAPTSGWDDEMPTDITSGQYLWQRTATRKTSADTWEYGPATLCQTFTNACVFMNSVSNNGFTEINGSKITTGTVVADNIRANATISNHVKATDLEITGGSVNISTSSETNDKIVLRSGNETSGNYWLTALTPSGFHSDKKIDGEYDGRATLVEGELKCEHTPNYGIQLVDGVRIGYGGIDIGDSNGDLTSLTGEGEELYVNNNQVVTTDNLATTSRNGLLAVTTQTVLSNTTLAGQASWLNNKSSVFSKSGYIPLGIVGHETTGTNTVALSTPSLKLTDISYTNDVGKCKVEYSMRNNFSSSVASISAFTVDILWAKV